MEQNTLLNKATVLSIVGLSDSTVWRLERKGEFPRRKQLSKNRVAWIKKEIDEWILSRKNAN